jgi:FkbM family methyltransferase
MSDENGMYSSLSRWSSTPIGTVIDIGASNGMWTRAARDFWPAAEYLLIEAQANPHEPDLRRLQAEFEGVQYVIAAAGDTTGTLYFYADDPFGGVASHSPFLACNLEVPSTTVDAEVASRALPAPFLLKLDTHGFEVPIFEGAAEALKQTSLIVVEAYNFKLRDECLRFHELCSFLEARGFRCIDVCDVLRRPDHVFWQLDMWFAPQSRPEFARNNYAAR